MSKPVRLTVFAALLLLGIVAALWFTREAGQKTHTDINVITRAGAAGRSMRTVIPSQGLPGFRSAAPATITGQVRDSRGVGITGATVCAGSTWRELSLQEREMRTCVRGDNDGRYRIEGLSPIPHFVQASAPHFVSGRFSGA